MKTVTRITFALIIAIMAFAIPVTLVGCGNSQKETPVPPVTEPPIEKPYEPGEPTEPTFVASFPSVHIGMAMGDITHHRVAVDGVLGGWQNTTIYVKCVDGEIIMEEAAVEIRGRGNSTWGLDKRPFRLRFAQARPMLDSGFSARNWTFIANHLDKSLLRNYSAYWLGRQLDGMAFSPNARFVNVYLGGEFQGVYMMSDQISEVTQGRVELTRNNDPALSEYLVEFCRRAPYEGIENEDWLMTNKGPFNIDFGVPSRNQAHVEYLRAFINNAHNAMLSNDWDEIQRWIDVDSFVDFYLVQELYRNVDVSVSSVFFTIRGTGENRRLFAGPVWDFDLSSGNAGHANYSPQGTRATFNIWFGSLMRYTPEFRDIVRNRWNEIRDNQVADLLDFIKTTALEHQSNFERNFNRWDILGSYVLWTPQNVIEIDTFMGQVEFLIDWLTQRKVWLDEWL